MNIMGTGPLRRTLVNFAVALGPVLVGSDLISRFLKQERFGQTVWRTRHTQVLVDATNPATGTEFGESLPESKPLPSETVQSNEWAEIVRRAVVAPPEELRLSLALAEYEEKSHTEFGEILCYSAKAVETRIYRACRQLRTSLAALLTGE